MFVRLPASQGEAQGLNTPPGFAVDSLCPEQDTYGLWTIFIKCSYCDKLTSGQNSNLHHYRETS